MTNHYRTWLVEAVTEARERFVWLQEHGDSSLQARRLQAFEEALAAYDRAAQIPDDAIEVPRSGIARVLDTLARPDSQAEARTMLQDLLWGDYQPGDKAPTGSEQRATRTEYALLMSGGGMHVRNDHPEVERIYPLADWIRHQQQDGARVFRREVVVVSGWAEEGEDHA